MPNSQRIPFKALSDQVGIINVKIFFGICKADYFQLWFLCKSDLHFYCRKKRLSELNTFKPNENDSITLLIRLRPAVRVPL